ncbi:MAG: reverse transcriptase-like protein [candidate division WOR-3 bacterium]
MRKQRYVVNVDASSENPGKSVCAAILRKDGEIISQKTEVKEGLTNNEAEYLSVMLGLKLFKENRESTDDELILISDSELVIKQLNGDYYVRSSKMKRINEIINSFICDNDIKVKFVHKKRDMNKDADNLARKKFEEVTRNESKQSNSEV